jgi:hypothetical protein
MYSAKITRPKLHKMITGTVETLGCVSDVGIRILPDHLLEILQVISGWWLDLLTRSQLEPSKW